MGANIRGIIHTPLVRIWGRIVSFGVDAPREIWLAGEFCVAPGVSAAPSQSRFGSIRAGAERRWYSRTYAAPVDAAASFRRRMRKPVMAGNWKMYKTAAETSAAIGKLAPMVTNAEAEVVICAP